MIVFPAVDMKNGKCVRLYQGKADAETVYEENPVNAALKWQNEGAKYLHLVDLDGAFSGFPAQVELVRKVVAALSIPVQLGGGIRTINDLKTVFAAGISRAILGTSAYRDESFVNEAVSRYGEKIAIALDARDGLLMAKGWVEDTGKDALTFAKELEGIGVKTVIYTDISCDGTLTGPNFDALQKLLDSCSMNVIASGGVSSKDDIKKLKKMKHPRLEGVIVGKALYSGAVTLEDIL